MQQYLVALTANTATEAAAAAAAAADTEASLFTGRQTRSKGKAPDNPSMFADPRKPKKPPPQ